MGDRQWFVLYVLICLEVGIFLLLVPWSVVWERNYFLQAYPALRPMFLHPVIRGTVSGLGLANIYVVLHEVVGRRRRAASSSTGLFPGGLRLPAEPAERAEPAEGADCDERGREDHSRQTSSAGQPVGSRAFVAHEKRS
jgi:hypothetical protein